MATADLDTGATSFEIIVAPGTGQQRTITLTGRGLPYRPFTLGSKQRNSTEFYPGNPIGVQQVYGGQPKPTTVRGMWKDKFLGGGSAFAVVDGATVSSARDLAQVCEDVLYSGQHVRVTWMQWIREGVIEDFEHSWETSHDCSWTMSFTWGSRAESLTDVPFANDTASDLTDVPNKLQQYIGQLTDAVASFQTGFDELYEATLGTVDNLTNSILSSADDLTNTVLSYTAVIDDANGTATVSGILNGLKLDGDDLVDAYENEIDGARLNMGGTYGDVIGDRAQARSQAQVAQMLASAAAQSQQQALANITSTVLAVYVARDGDDLRRVSQVYYGTPDGWRGLMIYNNLSDEVLRAGQIVVVPARTPAVAQT